LSKKFYESYIIIDGNLEENAIEEEIKKNEALLVKNDIEIVNIDKIGRKRLAYPIKKRQNGYYVCFEILAPANVITKLERSYILDENILRYLTIYVSSITKREKEEHFKNKAILQSKYEEEKLKLENEKLKAQAETVTVTEPAVEPA